MKFNFVAVAALAMVSSSAFADQYVCTVNCVGPSGQTQVVVQAGNASQAAQAVDKQSDQICRSAGHDKSTSSTMSSSQCSRK